MLWRSFSVEMKCDVSSTLTKCFCLRCPDGSHQLVRDAVPADAQQRVPQSGASAAVVSTGMRRLLSPTRNTQLPLPLSLTVVKQPPSSALRDWTTCCLSLATSGFVSLPLHIVSSFDCASLKTLKQRPNCQDIF